MRGFVCAPLGCKLTTSACAARHRSSRSAASPTKATLWCETCATCKVGAQHELGREPARWPDGSPVVRLELSAPAPEHQAPPKHVERIRDRGGEQLARKRKPTPEEIRAARRRAGKARKTATSRKGSGLGASHGGRVIAWGERHLTATQWSHEPDVKALGLKPETIWSRVHMQGWSPERALTTPPRKNHTRHTWGERTLTVTEWSREPDVSALGLSADLIERRIMVRGWSPERALTTPVDTARQRMGYRSGVARRSA